MGACHVWYDEIRMDVRDDEQTHVYVYIRAEGDCPHFLDGWHHKAFPGMMSTLNILESWAAGEEDPKLWEQAAPPSADRNATLDEAVKVTLEVATKVHLSNSGIAGADPIYELAKKLQGMKK